MSRRFLPALLLLSLFATPLLAQGEPHALRRVGAHPRIVNGTTTTAYPSTVALVDSQQLMFCTGTLIGCDTVLTAAHCVCGGTGAQCQPGGGQLLNASDVQIYAQHGGLFNVSKITVPPDYEFGVESDVAVLKLQGEVNGISPTPINTGSNPTNGTPGTIVGFGLTDGNLDDFGLKRVGQVESASCSAVPNAPHVCWNFTNPVGRPGTDSNTCNGDSGGPLFMDLGQGTVVAGVTSGGNSADCQPSDASWDANVFRDRNWILDNSGDLTSTTCGSLPQAGSTTAPIFTGESTVNANNSERFFTVEVPTGATALRVALNAEEGPFSSLTDVDLFVRAGLQPNTQNFDCSSTQTGVYEICEIAAPAAGTWHILVRRDSGSGTLRFQVAARVFGGEVSNRGCFANDTTLCIDDEPGDRRFQITVDVDTALGNGFEGPGRAIALSSLGIGRGGLFWFFDSSNPELLIKVLNGCGVTGHHWVFWSAGTTVGMVIRVEDTLTGRVKSYTNPDQTQAAPVTDTGAFTCDGS
jgi:hypothetical protein